MQLGERVVETTAPEIELPSRGTRISSSFPGSGPGTIDQISNSRTGRLGAAFELDHWVSERATVTAGIGVDVLTATRTNTAVGSDEPTVSMTTTVGATTRAQAGLIVFF